MRQEHPGLFDTLVQRPNAALRGGTWKPDPFPILDGMDVIGLDGEMTGKDKWKSQVVGLAISLPDGRDLYLPRAHQGGGNHDPATWDRWAREQLRGKTLVNLNTPFDVECMRNTGVDLEAQGCIAVDIAHAAALLDEHRYAGFNLDALGKEYVKRGKVDCPVHGKDIHRVHAAEVADYARGDSRLALDVYHEQLPALREQDLMYVFELESDLIWVTNEMERNGAPVDLPKLERWRQEVTQQIADGMMQLYQATGMRVNPNSPHSMMAMFKRLGIPYVDSQNDTLKRIAHPAVKLAASIKQQQSLKSKYLDKYWELAKDTGMLRYTLHQLRSSDDEFGESGTITGRYSSSGGDYGINVQQVMKPSKQRKRMGPDHIIRELFIAPEDREWVSSDAAQIEFRLFGEYARNPMMVAAYRNDPWTDFYRFVKDLLKERADYEISRDDSKVLNLASIYAQGRDKRMAGLGVDEDKLNLIDNAYNEAFPEARKLLRKCMQVAEDRGYVKTRLGRRGRFPDQDRYYRALNKVLQGTAADIMKLKLRRLYRERKTLDLTMRMTVHDEVDGDKPKGEAKRKEFEEVMAIQEFNDMAIPILWETGFGPNWMASGDPE